jgi:hypothetical protein
MKRLFLAGVAGLLLSTLNSQLSTSWAASPTYVTKTALGGGHTNPITGGATAIFKADPNLQLRIVGLNWNSDSNTAAAIFYPGAAAYAVMFTNPTTTFTTQYVDRTAGMVPQTEFVLEHAGVAYICTLVSTNSATNAVFNPGAFGVLSSVGDSLYALGVSNSIPIGATTNAQNGEAIYVGPVGRPVVVRIAPSLVTNKINTVTGRYE